MNKEIKKVNINPGCVSCGTCQVICPEVFKINGVCKINQDIDLNKYEKKIKESASMCPVKVIEVTT